MRETLGIEITRRDNWCIYRMFYTDKDGSASKRWMAWRSHSNSPAAIVDAVDIVLLEMMNDSRWKFDGCSVGSYPDGSSRATIRYHHNDKD